MSDDDLDRFNDSDSEPKRAAAEPTASRKAKGAGSNANDSSPAAAHAGGGGKAAQRRAKKAAAKRARLQRRRQERERFPRDRNDGSGSGDDDDDGSDVDEGTAAAPAPKSSNAARVHHGVLNVEGVVVDGKLILLDRKSGAVYSATRRAPDGSHLRVGTWNPETRAVTRLKEAAEQAKRMLSWAEIAEIHHGALFEGKPLFLTVASAGACFSVYLLYVLKFILGDFCIVCTGFHCVNFSMLAVAIYEYKDRSDGGKLKGS